MAEPNVTEIVTTTLYHRSKQIADNVSNSNALLQRLNSKGKVKPVPGGREILQPLEYAENVNFSWYSGYDTLLINPGTVIDSASYPWKQAAVNVRASGLEINVQNTGPEAFFDLLEARIRNAEHTMSNNLSTGIYSDGVTPSPKVVTGLQAQVATDPTTGTVGGIDRATYAFWRNQFLGPTASIDDTNIEGYMQQLYILCTRGNDYPDLIPADANFYNYFWTSLMAIQRIAGTEVGKRGWMTLKFLAADVIYDGDSGIPADRMYFLNTDYLYWRPHKNMNMVPAEKRIPVDEDSYVIPLLWAGNLTMSNAARQGVLFQGP